MCILLLSVQYPLPLLDSTNRAERNTACKTHRDPLFAIKKLTKVHV